MGDGVSEDKPYKSYRCARCGDVHNFGDEVQCQPTDREKTPDEIWLDHATHVIEYEANGEHSTKYTRADLPCTTGCCMVKVNADQGKRFAKAIKSIEFGILPRLLAMKSQPGLIGWFDDIDQIINEARDALAEIRGG